MSEPKAGVNAAPVGLVPLPNVQQFLRLVDRLQNRKLHMPGIGVFYGWSGLGKTASASYAVNKTRAFYVECDDTWSRRSLLDAIYYEVTATIAKGTVAQLQAELIKILRAEKRPLVIDEADYIVKKQFIDTVRDLEKKAFIPVILIGEENLPKKLEAYEKLHNRVLEWVPAQSCTVKDAAALARHYAHEITIDPELIAQIVKATGGVTRRVVVNIEALSEFSKEKNIQNVSLGDWPETRIYTGRPPLRQRPSKAGAK